MKKLKNIIIALVVMICGAGMLTGCDNSNENSVYSITVNQNLHGTISVDKETAKEGETITISADVDDGYSLYALLCDGVIITSSTITMPAKDITVSAIFEQIDQDFVLHKGSYVQIAEASTDGAYVQNNTFFNTVTIKENNLFDLFVKMSGQFFEFENVTYSQNDDTITANIGGMDYAIKVINNETFMIDDGNYMQIFYYQEDQTISQGNYTSYQYFDQENDRYYEFATQFKENNNIEIAMIENSSISFIEETTYDIKGNNLFIELEDRYIFAKLRNVENNSFDLYNMCFGSKEDATLLVFNEETNFIEFNKCSATVNYGNYFGNSIYYPTITNHSYYYQYNAIAITENNITLAGYDFQNNQYIYVENLPHKILGNYILVETEAQEYLFEIENEGLSLKLATNGYINYTINNNENLEFDNGHYFDEVSSLQGTYLDITDNYASVRVVNNPSEMVVEGNIYTIGNMLIVKNETEAYVLILGEQCGYINTTGHTYCLVVDAFVKGYEIQSYYESNDAGFAAVQYNGQDLDIIYSYTANDNGYQDIQDFCENDVTFIRKGNKILLNDIEHNDVYIEIKSNNTIVITQNEIGYNYVNNLISKTDIVNFTNISGIGYGESTTTTYDFTYTISAGVIEILLDDGVYETIVIEGTLYNVGNMYLIVNNTDNYECNFKLYETNDNNVGVRLYCEEHPQIISLSLTGVIQ